MPGHNVIYIMAGATTAVAAGVAASSSSYTPRPLDGDGNEDGIPAPLMNVDEEIRTLEKYKDALLPISKWGTRDLSG